MSEDGGVSVSEWMRRREAFVRAELLRFRIASYSLMVIAALTTVFVGLLAYRTFPQPTWELVILLGFSGLCAAIPLFRKMSISKDGGDFDFADPIDLLDRMEAKAEAARTETFEQTRQQISALSVQVSELSATVVEGDVQSTRAIRSAEAEELEKSGEPTLTEIRRSLPPPTAEFDPQKGRFGSRSETEDRRLTATTEPSHIGRLWRRVSLKLEATPERPLEGRFAYFFLHDTFEPDAYRVAIKPDNLVAEFETTAMGAFTVGVVADRGHTKLEINLASDAVLAPKDWKMR